MTRPELRTFLKAGVNGIDPQMDFGFGRTSEFASARNLRWPAAWWVTREGTSTDFVQGRPAPVDSWPIKLLIAFKDEMDSLPENNSNSFSGYEDLVDKCDEIGQKLTYKYNQIISGYKLLVISSIVRTPFVKRNSPDCITGVELSFTIQSVSTTSDCT